MNLQVKNFQERVFRFMLKKNPKGKHIKFVGHDEIAGYKKPNCVDQKGCFQEQILIRNERNITRRLWSTQIKTMFAGPRWFKFCIILSTSGCMGRRSVRRGLGPEKNGKSLA